MKYVVSGLGAWTGVENAPERARKTLEEQCNNDTGTDGLPASPSPATTSLSPPSS